VASPEFQRATEPVAPKRTGCPAAEPVTPRTTLKLRNRTRDRTPGMRLIPHLPTEATTVGSCVSKIWVSNTDRRPPTAAPDRRPRLGDRHRPTDVFRPQLGDPRPPTVRTRSPSPRTRLLARSRRRETQTGCSAPAATGRSWRSAPHRARRPTPSDRCSPTDAFRPLLADRHLPTAARR
jgi:hypothetical protein